MLAHQLAAAHAMAMELQAEAVMMLDLLSPTARKFYVYAVRAFVATAVAMLRA